LFIAQVAVLVLEPQDAVGALSAAGCAFAAVDVPPEPPA
jgi:hypothetical protein